MLKFLSILSSLFLSKPPQEDFKPMGLLPKPIRSFKYLTKVHSWEGVVEEVAKEVYEPSGLPYPVSVVLAIIHVESAGQANAHRLGSQFYGLTQVGKAMEKDTNTSRRVMAKGGVPGGREAIRAFMRWSKKYETRHGNDPDRLALGWKGGVGTLRSYNKMINEGVAMDEITQWLDQKRWRSWLYVRKFKAAHAIWSSSSPQTAEVQHVY